MVAAAWDTSNLVALYKDGLQCTSCCTEFCPGTDTCYIEPNSRYCETEDWDAWPPYGGPGKAPVSMTVAITGVIDCECEDCPDPQVNGVHILPRVNCSDGYSCFEKIYTVGGKQIVISLVLCDLFRYIPQFLIAMSDYHTLFRYDIPTPCKIIENDAPNFFQGCYVPHWPDYYPCAAAYKGTVSWRPGEIPAWDECTDYDVGDIVAHEGTFYICIQAHNAGVPPTCTGSKEPPNATYWDVV